MTLVFEQAICACTPTPPFPDPSLLSSSGESGEMDASTGAGGETTDDEPGSSAGSGDPGSTSDDGSSSSGSASTGGSDTGDVAAGTLQFDLDGLTFEFPEGQKAWLTEGGGAFIVHGSAGGGTYNDVAVHFPDTGVGVYDCSDGDYSIGVYWTPTDPEGGPVEHDTIDTDDCTVVITQVDDVGGQVVGTFEGTLRAFLTGDTVVVDNGVFNVTRFATGP